MSLTGPKQAGRGITMDDLPRHVRWKGATWKCSWVNDRQVRLASDPTTICLMGVVLFRQMVKNGEIVAEDHQ